MVASIPASRIVNVVPGVVSAGGTGLDMVGLLLTSNARMPSGVVLQFATQADVASYFGSSSDEAAKAAVYFNGYVNSFVKPAFVLFASYATAARSAFLRGGSLGLSLAQLQALNGTLAITTNGTTLTSSAINLSAATSFSNAASLIQAAFATPPFAVSFDSISNSFVFTTTATGSTVTMGFAAGTLASSLNLTQATGAVLSQGVAISTPAVAMDAIVAQTQDFVSFTTLFTLQDADILAFATWTNARANRFLFVGWTQNTAAVTNTDTTSPAKQIAAANLSGTALIWSPGADKAVFLLGYGASIDYNRPNARTVAAFRVGSGLTADVTNATIADNLLANGYNFYGSYATANDQFTWLYDGSVSGPFAWIDSYLNQIWMNNSFQLALMVTLGAVGQIPYNDDGYEAINAGLLTSITAAVDFGAIRAGVSLTDAQIAEVNGIAGLDISDVLTTRGWFLSIRDPGGAVRAARGTPACTFFYTDGQSVQSITLSSLQVQ